MARASLEPMVVNYLDGVYRCTMKRVPPRRFASIARRKDEVDGLEERDPTKAEIAVEVMLEIAEVTIKDIHCDGELLPIDELDIGELSAIVTAAMLFFGDRMNAEAVAAGRASS